MFDPKGQTPASSTTRVPPTRGCPALQDVVSRLGAGWHPRRSCRSHRRWSAARSSGFLLRSMPPKVFGRHASSAVATVAISASRAARAGRPPSRFSGAWIGENLVSSCSASRVREIRVPSSGEPCAPPGVAAHTRKDAAFMPSVILISSLTRPMPWRTSMPVSAEKHSTKPRYVGGSLLFILAFWGVSIAQVTGDDFNRAAQVREAAEADGSIRRSQFAACMKKVAGDDHKGLMACANEQFRCERECKRKFGTDRGAHIGCNQYCQADRAAAEAAK